MIETCPRTLIVYDSYGTHAGSVRLYLVDGDYRHLDMVYIATSLRPNPKIDQLEALMYTNNGTMQHKPIPHPYTPEMVKLIQSATYIIHAGIV